jgi:hypothetical protein
MPSLVGAPDKRSSITFAEYALLCWLRLNNEVASSYGIKECHGKTTIGSMLLQTLRAQGMNVEWFQRLPVGADTDAVGTNEAGAAWIKKATKRPGARMKQLSERPTVAPPDKAAIARHHGRLPRVAFPLLAKLAKRKRARRFTSCGNRICAPAAVALVERDQLVTFVESKLRCECGARLRYCKGTSHQVAACAKWCFVCEKSCKPRELLTSKPMHGDDYELNTQLNYAIVTCALSFARMVPFFRVLGMAALSETDHYAFKGEVSAVAAFLCTTTLLTLSPLAPTTHALSITCTCAHVCAQG